MTLILFSIMLVGCSKNSEFTKTELFDLNQKCSVYNSGLNENFSGKTFSYNDKDPKLNEGLTRNEIDNGSLVYLAAMWGTEDSNITHGSVFYSPQSNSCLLDIYRTATMGRVVPMKVEVFELRDYLGKNIVYRKVCKKTEYKDIHSKVLDTDTRIFIEDSEFINCKKEFYNELGLYKGGKPDTIVKKIIVNMFGWLLN